MEKEDNPRKAGRGKERDELEQEATDRAFDELMEEIDDEQLKQELKKQYEELKKKIKEKATEEAKKIAKKLLKKLLDIFGAAKLAGAMFWIWMQAGELGSALGQWMAKTIEKTQQDKVITYFKALDIDQFKGISISGFTYLIDTRVIIVDKDGNPVDAGYKINFDMSLGGDGSVEGSTGADGYEHKTTEKYSKDWPTDVSSVEIDADSINSVKYIFDIETRGGVCRDNTLIIFRVIVKAVVGKKKEGGDFFGFVAVSEPIEKLPTTRTFRIVDTEPNFDRVEFPKIFGKDFITGSFIPGGSFVASLRPTETENIAEVVIEELTIELAPFEIMGQSTGINKVSLNESRKAKGFLDLETRDFEVSLSTFLTNDLFGEGEKLIFYGKVTGSLDEEGRAYLAGLGKDVYPARLIELAEERQKHSFFFRILMLFRSILRKLLKLPRSAK